MSKSIKKQNKNKQAKKSWIESLKNWQVFVFLLLLSFVFYGNSLKNGYSMDDDLVTTTDNSVHERVEKGIAGIPEIFGSRFVDNGKQSYSYRPIVTTSFAIEYQFFGSNSTVSHFVSVVLYGLSCYLIFLLLLLLIGDKGFWIAFLAAVIFMIHPIHNEVVNNIKCRDELFCFIFGILAIIKSVKYFDTRKLKYLIFVFLLFVLSFLSKETGKVFLVLTPLTLYFFRKLSLKLGVLFFLLPLGGQIIKSLLKSSLKIEKIRVIEYFENPLVEASSFIGRLPTFFYSEAYYLKLFIVPYPLRYYYGYNQIPLINWSHFWTIMGIVILLVFGIVFLIRFKRKEVWLFGLSFYLLAISGACNLLFPAVGVIAERFLFIGSMGLCLVLAVLVVKLLSANAKLTKIVGAIVVLICLFFTVERNTVWKSRMSLYAAHKTTLANSAKGNSLLGQEYASRAKVKISSEKQSDRVEVKSEVDSAIKYFTKTLEIYPDYYKIRNNTGAMYYSFLGDVESAYPYFKRAVSYKEDYVEGNFNLGNASDWYQNIFGNLTTKSRNSKLLKPKDTLISGYISIPLRQLNEVIIKKDAFLKKAQTNSRTSLDYFNNINNGLKTVINQPENQFFSMKLINNLDSKKEIILGMTNSNARTFFVDSIIKEDFRNGFFKINDVSKSKGEVQQFINYSSMYFESKTSEIFRRVIDLDNSYHPAYKKLTLFYQCKGQYDSVIVLNLKATESNEFENNLEFCVNIANAYINKNEISNALKYFDKGISSLVFQIETLEKSEFKTQKERRKHLTYLNQMKIKLLKNCFLICQREGDLIKARVYQDELRKYENKQ